MNQRILLQTCFAIGLAHFAGTACVARECTGEEAEEVGASGGDECTTFEPVKASEGDEESETLPYTPGTDLVIEGDFRNLEIERGTTGEIVVNYRPRVDLGESRSQEVIDETLAELDVTVGESGGAIEVNASRRGDSNVAALIEIKLPDEFDGEITISQADDKNDGGEVELSSVGAATSLTANLRSSGDTITLANASGLETAVINVSGFWNIRTGDFLSPDFAGAALRAENGDIKTGFAAVPSGGSDVLVESTDGDIVVALPGGGEYTMQATSGDFSFGASVPSECNEAANDGGGSLTCGALTDTITFTLNAPEGSATVDRFLSLAE